MCEHDLTVFACGQIVTKQESLENCPDHREKSSTTQSDRSQGSDEMSCSPWSKIDEGSTEGSSSSSTKQNQAGDKRESSSTRRSSSDGSTSDCDEVLPFAVQRQANKAKIAGAQHNFHRIQEHKRTRDVSPEQCLARSLQRLCLELDEEDNDGGATIIETAAPVLRGAVPLFGEGVSFLAGENPVVTGKASAFVEKAPAAEKAPIPASKTPVPASKTLIPASKTPVPAIKAPIHTGRPSIGPPAFLGTPIGILTPEKVYPHGPSNAVLKDRTLLPNRGGDPFVAGRRRNLKTRKGKKGKKEEQDNEEDWVSEED